MKKLPLFLMYFMLISLSNQAQTTFNYSGTSSNPFIVGSAKVGGIGRNNITSGSASFHIGLVGTVNNATFGNVGVLGTTSQSTAGGGLNYYAVYGDNYNNGLTVNNGSVTGGFFSAQNSGTNANTSGVSASSFGYNNTSSTYGIVALATNNSNTTANKTIAVRGETLSGTSTVTSYLKSVANPGGYFKSNDGQGVYATTDGSYILPSTGNRASQAVTGYSNQPSIYLNAGVVGFAEGSGSFKFGTYGYVDGIAATGVSAAVCGQDNINSASTYAGYFYGKVGIASSLLVSSASTFGGAISGTTAAFSGCVTASNLSCPSDIRYKKNIIPLENALYNILKINGVRYDWKQEEFPEKNFSDKNQIGFIAQEIEKIFPEMVITNENGFKSVDYARLTPVLVEAIKELTLRNEQLEVKNQKLESRLDKIETLLSVSNSSTGK
ncbi:MAG: tail fiber domain-containing protein [Bacteroidota bacterium]